MPEDRQETLLSTADNGSMSGCCARDLLVAIRGQPPERQSIHDDLERVRADMHQLVCNASAQELRRRTNGTRWTNAQMLWHIAFGYLLVRRLRLLIWLFGRLPEPFSRAFAGALNAGTRPFHYINYVGAVGGALVFHGSRLTRQFDHTIDRLHRRLDAESDDALGRRMHFPVGWDPFFRDSMTLVEVYRYPTRHYDFHRAQLTLD